MRPQVLGTTDFWVDAESFAGDATKYNPLRVLAASLAGSVVVTDAAPPAVVSVNTDGTKDWCLFNYSTGYGTPTVPGSTPWKKNGGWIARSFRTLWGWPTVGNSSNSAVAGTTFQLLAADQDDSVNGQPFSTTVYSTWWSDVANKANYGYSWEIPCTGQPQTLKLYTTNYGNTFRVTGRMRCNPSVVGFADIVIPTVQTNRLITVAFTGNVGDDCQVTMQMINNSSSIGSIGIGLVTLS